MKKFLLTSVLISMAASSALAAEPSAKEISNNDYLSLYQGMEVLGMSANGEYVAGFTSEIVGRSFMANTQTGEAVCFTDMQVDDDGNQLTGVSNNGIAVGFDASHAVKCHLDGSFEQLESPGFGFAMARNISSDGSTIVGSVSKGAWTELMAACWDADGKMQLLPYPSSATVGTFKINGCEAAYANEDGSIIVGWLVANPNTYPLIFWERQPDGTYQYVNVLTDLYEPLHQNVWHEDKSYPDGGYYTFEKGPNPWMRMQPQGLTNDGKYIVLVLQDNRSNALNPPYQLGFYNVETGELTAEDYDPRSILADGINITGVSNDLTVVGINALSVTAGVIPFVKKYGEEAVPVLSLCSNSSIMQEAEYWFMQGMPVIASGISADGRYISGYYTEVRELKGPDGQYSNYLVYPAFLIDMGEEGGDTPGTDAVESIDADELAPAEYFTLDGVKVLNPDKGIFIEKRGSQTRKVVKN